MEESWGKLDDEAAINLTEMMHLKRQGQSSEYAANRLCLHGQGLPPSPNTQDAAAHIKVGSYYEIDHSKLPAQTPDQLKPIRIIMVSKKSKYNVSLRFPSLFSLRAHFRDENLGKPEGKMLPSLDEKYVMGSELAGEVLYRRIRPHEIAVQRNLWSFWVVPSLRKPYKDKPWCLNPAINTCYVSMVAKKGSLLSELKSTGMIRWGKRRQVRFLRRHVEQQKEQIKSSNSKDEEEEKELDNEQSEDEDKGEEKEEEEEEEEEETTSEKSDKENVETDDESDEKGKAQRKRKVRQCSYRTEETKKAKRVKQNQINASKQSKRKVLKKSISRWSLERYKLAERNMLKILKEKGAVFGNAILRPALRTEARKLIGDTGLLDHLLKHMAGKVAPGGEERFRRRHNADGAMEYWLEKADLLNIRKEAGVQDPYWIPPPGWKLGDHPTQDPICARELKEIREEMAKLKREVQYLGTKKQQEDLAIVSTPDSSLASEIMGNNSLLLPLKERYIDLVNKKTKIEEQLMEISQSLREMEEEMGRLKSVVEEQNKPASEEMLRDSIQPRSTCAERKTTELMHKEKEKGAKSGEEQNISQIEEETQPPAPATITKAVETTENKAAKIERLKSGFRICKPQGSFLWPNMALSPQVVVPLGGLLAVHNPPSVSSSTASEQQRPNSTVKPLAEWRPVNVSSSPKSVKATPPPSPRLPSPETTPTTIITTKTTLINLNEIPGNNNKTRIFGSSNPSHSTASAVTYQRRHQNVITSITMPHLVPAKKENKMGQLNGGDSQQQRRCSASSPSKSVGAKTWWALPNSSSSLNNN
ncbi:hypothetical protein SLEP1_g28038 [Rubroshorea leprosula]|uniref:PTC1-like winged helix-turn-helix domain-containing protein n=1 Tax=Rubroshorea leprosula TaxID=152421 RepID=A0AAV5JYE3_9ROSI|nr:hypothetical protein SLEP1_g28038 [Rubroshorea leprosula]